MAESAILCVSDSDTIGFVSVAESSNKVVGSNDKPVLHSLAQVGSKVDK